MLTAEAEYDVFNSLQMKFERPHGSEFSAESIIPLSEKAQVHGLKQTFPFGRPISQHHLVVTRS